MTQDLAERVTRLERENRFIKLAGLCALVVVLALLLLGKVHRVEFPEVIKARSFQVVDENRETRAELSYWPKQGLEAIEDLKKKLEDPAVEQAPERKEDILKRIEELEEDPSLFGLRIYGGDAWSVSLVGRSHEAPALAISGEGGISALHSGSLYLSSIGNGRISLGTEEMVYLRLDRWPGPGSMWLSLTEDSSSLFIQDGSFRDRARLEVHNQKTSQAGEEMETPSPSLILLDEEGGVIWEAP